ncbi:hypothetical protein M405DRAFT_832992, partial [Rhizopogon salebrosus TDB-379]
MNQPVQWYMTGLQDWPTLITLIYLLASYSTLVYAGQHQSYVLPMMVVIALAYVSQHWPYTITSLLYFT